VLETPSIDIGNRTNGIWLGFEENPSVYIPGNCAAGQYGLTAAGPCSNSSAANLTARRALTLANPAEGKYFGSVAQTTGGTGARRNLAQPAMRLRMFRGRRLTFMARPLGDRQRLLAQFGICPDD